MNFIWFQKWFAVICCIVLSQSLQKSQKKVCSTYHAYSILMTTGLHAWCKHGKWSYHYLNKWTIVLSYNRSLKYFCYYMISAVNLQPFIGGESQIATKQTFVLIIMSFPSYRRHAYVYLLTRRPRPQVSTYRVHFRFPWLVSGDMSQQHVLGLVIPCDRTFKVFPPFNWLHPWIWVKFNLPPKCWKMSALLSLSCLLAERLTRHLGW